MSPILFFIFFFTCTGVGKIFLQINSAAVAFIDILIAAWEGLSSLEFITWFLCSHPWFKTIVSFIGFPFVITFFAVMYHPIPTSHIALVPLCNGQTVLQHLIFWNPFLMHSQKYSYLHIHRSALCFLSLYAWQPWMVCVPSPLCQYAFMCSLVGVFGQWARSFLFQVSSLILLCVKLIQA